MLRNHRLRAVLSAVGVAATLLMPAVAAPPAPVPPVVPAPATTPPVTTPTTPVTAPITTPVTAPTPLPDAAPAPSYVLSTDDQLTVAVLGHETLTTQVTVLPDGTITVPIVGKVKAAGLTVDALTDRLTHGFSDQINQPQVTVSVRESRPRQINVVGAARQPGLYAWRDGWRLLNLLAACGGSAQPPELTQVMLLTDSNKKTVPIDLVKLLSGENPALNVPVMPGDVLFMSVRDPAAAMVQVIGEVGKPGPYIVPADGATILSLLTQAGNATPRAAMTRAQITHAGKTKSIDLHPLQSNLEDPAGAIKLQAGDVLLVPENKDKIAVLGEVRSPSVYLIPDGEILSTTTALAMAGGPTQDGNQKTVNIVRNGADGKPTVISMNTQDVLKGNAKAENATLQPGDILYIPTRRKVKSTGEILQSVSPFYFLGGLLR